MPTAEQEPVDEFLYLWVLLAQTFDALVRARERDYAQFDITNERRAVLFIIDRNGGRATPVQIAGELFRELHSVTELLKRMEKAELILRHKGKGRSRVEVTLSDKGKDVLEQSRDNETEKRLFSTLTKRQRTQLAATLWKLRGKVLEDLGIREWELHLPENPYEVEG